jgi:hypothetical protein
MYFSNASFVATALLAASSVNGHMIMAHPIPYSPGSLNNSPLAADGSDFPCKLRSDTYTVSSMNTVSIGERIELNFTGSATHGGGSCQLSLTTDMQPSKNTVWQVIHSIEGGCPANVDGNLAANPNGSGASNFFFQVPSGIAPGQYTLAWTWFNRIGNREMYMNCAPMKVTGGTSSKREVVEEQTTAISKRSSFPPLFVANVNGCTTKEGVDIRFPDPGASVEYDGQPSNLQPVGQAACTGGPGPGPTGASPSNTAPASSAAPTSAATSAASSVSAGSGGVFAQGAGSQSTTSATSVLPAATSAAASPPGTGSSTTSGALSGACSTEGQWNCIGGTTFQRCASGVWSVVEPVAAGTSCTAGQSTNLKVAAAKRDDESVSNLHRRRVFTPSQLKE